jgi:hypothetical protein
MIPVFLWPEKRREAGKNRREKRGKREEKELDNETE